MANSIGEIVSFPQGKRPDGSSYCMLPNPWPFSGFQQDRPTSTKVDELASKVLPKVISPALAKPIDKSEIRQQSLIPKIIGGQDQQEIDRRRAAKAARYRKKLAVKLKYQKNREKQAQKRAEEQKARPEQKVLQQAQLQEIRQKDRARRRAEHQAASQAELALKQAEAPTRGRWKITKLRRRFMAFQGVIATKGWNCTTD